MNTPDISVPLLRAFLDSAAEGSFAAVARRRGVDPSIVSRQVQTLEMALGFRLFDRATRRLALTEAGDLYRLRVRAVLDELDSAGEEAADLLRQPRGLLRVTTSEAFGERWLVPRLKAFRRAFPDIALDLALTNRVVDLVEEGFDLAVRLAAEPKGALIARKLMQTRYHVVASPSLLAREGSLAAPEDIASRHCVTLAFPGHRSRWRFRSPVRAVDVRIASRLSISSPLAVRKAALEGHGLALLADWLVEDDLASGALVDCLPGWEAAAEKFGSAAWLLYPARGYMPGKLRVFIDHLVRTRLGP